MAKKQKAKEQRSNGISDFIIELRQAAVNMRGSIEPAGYKRYVLPLIFLRFLSIRIEKRRTKLQEMVKEPESPYYDYIMAHAQADDIKVKIDDALETLGTAGFVIATGKLSKGETARLEVREQLVEFGYVESIVQLTGQLFADTQIPCSLWFLSKNRDGTHGMRKRKDETLFIDGRKPGSLIPGSRKQKALSEEELEEQMDKSRELSDTIRKNLEMVKEYM